MKKRKGRSINPLTRFSVSVEENILQMIDDKVKDGSYPNRSDALRAMVRSHVTAQEFSRKGEVIGIISVVYDHHKRNLVSRMLQIQHDTPAVVLGSQHYHLDHHHCVEAILLRGKAADLEQFQKHIQSLRGMMHTTFSVLSPAKHLT